MESSTAENDQSMMSIITRQDDPFTTLIQNNPTATIITDLDTLIISCNPAFELLFGYTSDEVKGRNIDTLLTDEKTFLEAINYSRRVILLGETIRASGFRCRKDKSKIEVEIRGVPIFDLSKKIGMLILYTDVSQSKRSTETLKDFHNSFLHIMDSIDADVYVSDMATYEILFMNKHIRDSFGGDFVGQICWQVFHKETEPCTLCTNNKLINKKGKPTGDLVWEAKNPITGLWYKNSDRAILWDDDRYVRLEIATDITKIKVAELHQEYQATHDSLTNLPNRLLFIDRLNHAMQLAQRVKTFAAVLYLDLDRFKVVNDKLGHPIGDLLLKGVAERLQLQLRGADTVARISGDEFAIILEKISHPDDTLEIARKIIKAISAPFFFEGNKVFITASLGISVFPDDGNDVESLIKKADEAMYIVKRKGKNGFLRAVCG
jgi:diguanylate cyclase (GGDEF)-like protein/PAS domain S-box-containing protein